MSRKQKAIASLLVIVPVIAALILAYFLYVPSYLPKDKVCKYVDTGYKSIKGTRDCIHFLSTGSSDCIIIETNGMYAMVDAAEDSDFPEDKPNLELKGYEDEVVDYLLKNCADENGKVTLEFVVGTHAHSDHIGGFDTVIENENITVKKAYLKEYNPEYIKKSEVNNWDNEEVYTQMKSALEKEGSEIITSAEAVPFEFGDFTITIFNGQADTNPKRKGENENSFALLVEKDGVKAFLAGDMNNIDGDEKRLAPEIGKVDLIKAGHHGYIFSSTSNFIKTLSPKVAIITNTEKKPWKNVIRTYSNNGVFMFPTVENDGITAYFTDNNGLILDKGYIMNQK